MTKQERLNLHKKRQSLSVQRRAFLDEALYDVVVHHYQYHNAYKMIKTFLDQGANPNYYKDGRTIVHLLSGEPLELLQLAVEYGGDLTLPTKQTEGSLIDYDVLPIHHTCSCGLIDNTKFILQKLKEQGLLEKISTAKTAKNKYCPRVCASMGSQRQALHALLDSFGVPHNIPDSTMWTELCWSASYDDLESVIHLKKTGAKAIIQGENGKFYKASRTPELSGQTRKILKQMEEQEQNFAISKQ